MKYILLEHHPNDSRLKIVKDEICQTLNQRMGTGGGNVPLVMEIHDVEDTDSLGRPGGGSDALELQRIKPNYKSTDGWASSGSSA